jgi:hypothetical protein
MDNAETTVPYGFCECGCGERAPVAVRTTTSKGWVKGEPLRYVRGHNRRTGPDAYRVDPDTGCWDWLRARQENGYGAAWDGHRVRYAHRVYYERLVGPIPAGHVLDHLCRNPGCINPEHLEPVTDAENVRRGDQTRLTEADVIGLREIAARLTGWSRRGLSEQLAPIYGVTASHVQHILAGRKWATPKLRNGI